MSTLGIFMKHPVAGRVKTRLGSEIGYEESAELYRAFIQDLLERLNNVSNQRVFSYGPNTPDAQQFFVDHTTPSDQLWPQPETTLGERMASFFKAHLEHGPVVIVGSDSPSIPPCYVEEAFVSLKQHDLVIGPATDGGYYLIGQSRYCPEIFSDITWSEADVLLQTINRIREQNLSLHLLPPWYDIDSLDDLKFLHGQLNALHYAGRTNEIPWKTYQILQQLDLITSSQ